MGNVEQKGKTFIVVYGCIQTAARLMFREPINATSSPVDYGKPVVKY